MKWIQMPWGPPCEWWHSQNSISNNLLYFFEVSSFIGKVLSLLYCAGHALINPGTLKVENRHIWESSREPYLVVFWNKYILQLKNIFFNNKKSKLIIRIVLLPLMPFFLCSKQNFIHKKNNYVSSFSFSTEIRHVGFFFLIWPLFIMSSWICRKKA